MKKFFLFLLSVSFLLTTSAQDRTIDSLKVLFVAGKLDTVKARLSYNICIAYTSLNPDSALKYAYTALQLAEHAKYRLIQTQTKISIGYIIGYTGNYVKGLQLILEAKTLAEKENNKTLLVSVHHQLGNIYKWQKQFRLATNHYLEALAYGGTYTTEMNLGKVYQEMNQLDSALYFENLAYQHCLSSPIQTDLASVLTNLGRINQRLGNITLGRNYLSMAEAVAIEKKQQRHLGFIMLDLTLFFKETANTDSAIHYCKRIFTTPGLNPFKPILLDAAQYMTELYTNKNTDSAFKYLHLATTLREDLLGMEKTLQMQTLQYEEELRQQQIAAERIKLAEERKNNLQYAAIAIGLITFVILFLVLSRSIIVKQKFIEFFAILGLLAVFEFINLFIHPYLAHATNHSPVLMLIILIAIGALLIPLHHKLEKWITKIMIEKNKKIRLEAAKKTIAKLEPTSANLSPNALATDEASADKPTSADLSFKALGTDETSVGKGESRQ